VVECNHEVISVQRSVVDRIKRRVIKVTVDLVLAMIPLVIVALMISATIECLVIHHYARVQADILWCIFLLQLYRHLREYKGWQMNAQ
jgi:hypothetical protein